MRLSLSDYRRLLSPLGVYLKIGLIGRLKGVSNFDQNTMDKEVRSEGAHFVLYVIV